MNKPSLKDIAESLRMNADDLNRMDTLPTLARHLRNAADQLDANLAQPAQAVDVGVIREVIADLRTWRDEGTDSMARALTRALSGEKAGPVDGWISVKERLPERNKPAIYWHKSEFGGFAAIADEWRDEHHLAQATHWMPYIAPASPAPDKEGQS